MNPSTRLNQLRFSISEEFQEQSETLRTHTPEILTPGLHHLLTVPIRERLILLARIDGATPVQVRRAVRASYMDSNLQSPEMIEAIKTWSDTMDNAYLHLPTRSNWRQQRSGPVEKHLRQLIWADVAVALIGEAAMPQLVQNLTLKQRLILYCLIVEEMPWKRPDMPLYHLFPANTTTWQVRQSINICIQVLGGL